MASTPPPKCLRGIVRGITPEFAAQIGTGTDVPIACYLYDSIVGIKSECSYQRTDGRWVEYTQPTTTGNYEGPSWEEGSQELQNVCNEINRDGMVPVVARKLQQWANDNTYAFFSPHMSNTTPAPAPTPTPTPTDPVTPANFMSRVNAALGDLFVFQDTNDDRVPEFHGR